MIVEALAHFFERATAHARKAGYVHEQIALLARHRRQRRAWAPHLARTRDFIERMARTTAGGQVVVLGSGALLDIPVAALAQRFGDVVLVDVFHPRIARRTARRFTNVRLHTCDLLGASTRTHDGLPQIRLDAWRSSFPAPDLVVSANLLSQLPILPLQRAGAGDDAEALLMWTRSVIRGHLQDLTTGPGAACVVTEKLRRRYDRDGAEIDCFDGLAGVDIPAPEECWTWEIGPFGEIDRKSRTVVDVRAFRVPPA